MRVSLYGNHHILGFSYLGTAGYTKSANARDLHSSRCVLLLLQVVAALSLKRDIVSDHSDVLLVSLDWVFDLLSYRHIESQASPMDFTWCDKMAPKELQNARHSISLDIYRLPASFATRMKPYSAYRRSSSILALQLETLGKVNGDLVLYRRLVLASEMQAKVRLAHHCHDRSLQSVYRPEGRHLWPAI